jgi:hypothetical protein
MEKATFRTLCLGLLLLSTTAFSQGGNSFSGVVTYHDNYPMSGVVAHLRDSTGIILDSTITDNTGTYSFSNVAAGTYKVTFTTTEDAGGVSLTDPFIILQKLSDPTSLTAIQRLAADVNGDGEINIDDYNKILIAYMNEENPFPIGPWVFEELHDVTLPAAAREGFTTRGGSSGDVNGSLMPDPKSISIFLDNPTINMTINSSDPIEFKMSGMENNIVAGMHLVIDIPDGLQALKAESSIPDTKVTIQNNQVRVTWIDRSQQGFEIVSGQPLLIITTKATSPSRDGNNYSLSLNNQSHFIDVNGNMISGVALLLPTIHVNMVEDFAVAVYPNPFRENTNLNCDLPEDGSILISLFDQAGRQVREISDGNCSAGNYQVKIDGSDLMPGIYHYTIKYSGDNQLINSGTIIKSK